MTTLTIRDGKGTFTLPLATEREVAVIEVNEYAGGSESRNGVAPFEPNAGEAIVSMRTDVAPYSGGDVGYTLSKRAAQSSVEDITVIRKALRSLISVISENKDEKSKEQVERLEALFEATYAKHTSANERYELTWHATSHEKKVFGAVVETKTARLHVNVVARIIRLVTPAEWAQAQLFLENAAKEKRPVTIDVQ